MQVGDILRRKTSTRVVTVRMDETVGTIRQTLAETGLDRNTILMFTSDHANHFKTRNTEYKRSPHETSIHIPLIVDGPGFNRGMQIAELVSQVDLMPSLLDRLDIEAQGGQRFGKQLQIFVDDFRFGLGVFVDLLLRQGKQPLGPFQAQHLQGAGDLHAVVRKASKVGPLGVIAEKGVECLLHVAQIGLDLPRDLREHQPLLGAPRHFVEQRCGRGCGNGLVLSRCV